MNEGNVRLGGVERDADEGIGRAEYREEETTELEEEEEKHMEHLNKEEDSADLWNDLSARSRLLGSRCVLLWDGWINVA
ncbi:hypothetical protein CgunFtcFv8_010270 [Champsocephalus gunnari]|uniref:Uncharacterized protein n=1 Tax=Champsocephalus gunnari TaxID=52237 RepID=A0AAN8HUD2_CHAGU|nr:hypothetical protein CgunFtcFv8_010270 [Champsocephalus gunnari]